ncbi:MAG: hypothetical protein J5494_03440 [Candidatus Methanomethylophilaceae archaeon]|nr:hypothetical protein [Candidatus Methanomethylophilaceae archaeon]
MNPRRISASSNPRSPHPEYYSTAPASVSGTVQPRSVSLAKRLDML